MKHLRYGIIGIKGIGNLHCRFVNQNEKARLTALADIDSEYLSAKSAGYSVHGFKDYREMLDSGLVDAVSICTPHFLHYQMCMDCLDAGIHVLVEKPLAIAFSDAEKIVSKAKAKNLKLSVGHQYRTFRTSKTIKHLIEAGEIGKIMRGLWTWFEFRSDSYYERDSWRTSWHKAGGGISIHDIHDLDLICWMFGKPVQVNAMLGTQLHNIALEDFYCANILFANGAYCSIQVNINQPNSYSVRQVAGDKGLIIINDLKSLTFNHKDKILLGKYEDTLPVLTRRIKNPGGQPVIRWEKVDLAGDPPKWKKMMEFAGLIRSLKPHGLSILIDSFIDAILTGDEPIVTGESTLDSLELYNAILLSAFRKKTIDLPINRHEFSELFQELSLQHTKKADFNFFQN